MNKSNREIYIGLVVLGAGGCIDVDIYVDACRYRTLAYFVYYIEI